MTVATHRLTHKFPRNKLWWLGIKALPALNRLVFSYMIFKTWWCSFLARFARISTWACFLKLRRSTFQEKIKIYGAPMKPSELFCFKETVNFAALLFFLATGNKKFQRAMMQMRSILPQLELSRTALLGRRLAARVFARLLTVGNYYYYYYCYVGH